MHSAKWRYLSFLFLGFLIQAIASAESVIIKIGSLDEEPGIF